MSLEAITQDIQSILEIVRAPGNPEEKGTHLLTLAADIRKLIKEELKEINLDGEPHQPRRTDAAVH